MNWWNKYSKIPNNDISFNEIIAFFVFECPSTIMMRTIPAIIRNVTIFGLGVALTSYNVKRGLEMIIVAFKVAFAS